MGLKVTKYHKVLRYTEEAYLKNYIMYNTNRRAEATSDAMRSYYKFLCNVIFGSFLLQKEKNIDVRIVKDAETCLKLTSLPSFKAFKILNNELSFFEMKKTSVKLDKFPLVGSQILELSKLHFYRVYYGSMKEYFKDQVKLLYMDDEYKEPPAPPCVGPGGSLIILDGNRSKFLDA